jgi:membrane protease subunit HflC
VLKDPSGQTQTIVIYDSIEVGRNALSEEMLVAASRLTPEFGVELIDIILRQIKYSDDLTESVYKRMIKDRNQIAQAYRSYGEGKKLEWLGRLTNERMSIISEANKKANEIKGQADAEATAIYADAYSKDEEFFEFWRLMESYKETVPAFNKILSTGIEYFKYLGDKKP